MDSLFSVSGDKFTFVSMIVVLMLLHDRPNRIGMSQCASTENSTQIAQGMKTTTSLVTFYKIYVYRRQKMREKNTRKKSKKLENLFVLFQFEH